MRRAQYLHFGVLALPCLRARRSIIFMLLVGARRTGFLSSLDIGLFLRALSRHKKLICDFITGSLSEFSFQMRKRHRWPSFLFLTNLLSNHSNLKRALALFLKGFTQSAPRPTSIGIRSLGIKSYIHGRNQNSSAAVPLESHRVQDGPWIFSFSHTRGKLLIFVANKLSACEATSGYHQMESVYITVAKSLMNIIYLNMSNISAVNYSSDHKR